MIQALASRRLSEALLVAGLAAWALIAFGEASRRTPYHPDESNYLARGRYFFALFLDHDTSSQIWREGRHPALPNIHTQPMLANYIVGATLWLSGEDPERFARYRWERSRAENERDGRVPDRETLLLVRGPMVWLGAGAMVLLYLLGRSLGGTLAGVVAAAIGISSPLAQESLTIVHNEAPLALFVLLALLVGLLGARRGERGGLPFVWAGLTGLALGLAFESKLTALLSLAATLGWGGAVALSRWRGRGAGLASAWTAGRGWLVAIALAYGVFVLLNPHLWPSPLEHTLHMLQLREEQMEDQQAEEPSAAVYGVERPGRVLSGSLVKGAWAGSRGLALEALAAGVGLLALAARVLAGWRDRRAPPAEGLALATVLAYFVGIGLTLPLDWPRYYLPTLLFGALLGGLGATTAAGWLRGLATRGWRRPLELAPTDR
jgi:hypothetical protein